MARFNQSLAGIRGKLQRGLQLDVRDQLFVMDSLIPTSRDMGSFDASVNTFPTSTGSGSNGIIQKGDTFQISVAGTLDGIAVTVGQTIRALVNLAGNVATDWSINANAGTNFTRWAEISITNTEALALRATPKTLVAAPGAGKVLEFVSLHLYFDFTAAYTESSANLAVRYTGTTGTIVSQAIEATGFADAAADTITSGQPKIDVISAKTASENQLLCLHNTGVGEWGAGNAANVLRAKVTYRIWNTGF